jgi:hypothetical protein
MHVSSNPSGAEMDKVCASDGCSCLEGSQNLLKKWPKSARVDVNDERHEELGECYILMGGA